VLLGLGAFGGGSTIELALQRSYLTLVIIHMRLHKIITKSLSSQATYRTFMTINAVTQVGVIHFKLSVKLIQARLGQGRELG
jgi:hypothetical protein